MHNNIQIHDVLAESSCYDVFHYIACRSEMVVVNWFGPMLQGSLY